MVEHLWDVESMLLAWMLADAVVACLQLASGKCVLSTAVVLMLLRSLLLLVP